MNLIVIPAKIKIPKGFRKLKVKENLQPGDYWGNVRYGKWDLIGKSLVKDAYQEDYGVFIRAKEPNIITETDTGEI